MKIPFNKPHICGGELGNIQKVLEGGHLAGNGPFTKKCHQFFEDKYGFKKVLMTTSCTDALEMCAILVNIEPGDEVIMPSFTFVSTANPFVLRGAKVVFVDSEDSNPNLDVGKIESLISSNTKAIVCVHYAGVACEMDELQSLARKHNLFLIEDAAQGLESFYKGKPLGSFGDLAAFSFHQSKNIIAGEGGLLSINNEKLIPRAEIIWEKGTNRAAFFRGEVSKYNWQDVGSSFLPSELISAFLWTQLENLNIIQKKRINIWELYRNELNELAENHPIELPFIPDYATNNAHMFYLVCESLELRTAMIQHLKSKGISAFFHYLSLHESPFYQDKHDGRELPNTIKYTDQLVRLPFYFDLKKEEVLYVCQAIKDFFKT